LSHGGQADRFKTCSVALGHVVFIFIKILHPKDCVINLVQKHEKSDYSMSIVVPNKWTHIGYITEMRSLYACSLIYVQN